MKLFWTEAAKDDLIAIQRYIADDNPTAAKKWIGRLKQRVMILTLKIADGGPDRRE